MELAEQNILNAARSAATKEEGDRPRYREFTVTPGLRGFKVRIGCSEAYFSNADHALAAIQAYMRDPQRTEINVLGGDIRLFTANPAAGQATPVPEHQYPAAGEGIRLRV